MKIRTLLKKHFQSNLPFVVYRKPNSGELHGLFLKNSELKYTSTFAEQGFVFAPFDSSNQSVIFEFDKGDFYTETLTNININQSTNTSLQSNESSENHISLVSKAIEYILNSEVEKIVVSRTEDVLLQNFELVDFLEKLLVNYKNAFVYCWYHPKVGIWMGASPETLLLKKEHQLVSVSLAGTKKIQKDEPVIWGAKEIEEQQLVTRFIENSLKEISNSLEIESTNTVYAGSLAHLKTRIHATLQPSISLKKCIEKLHPTPAVCGLPKNKALQFILENEGYSRKFYTGFLGEINMNNQTSHLFVNLRCMELIGDIAKIYVGGGITKDSIPENEWEETVAKTQTLKKFI